MPKFAAERLMGNVSSIGVIVTGGITEATAVTALATTVVAASNIS